jgi:hypothetical protein
MPASLSGQQRTFLLSKKQSWNKCLAESEGIGVPVSRSFKSLRPGKRSDWKSSLGGQGSHRAIAITPTEESWCSIHLVPLPGVRFRRYASKLSKKERFKLSRFAKPWGQL